MKPSSKTITFTLDLEDHRPNESLPKRYPAITDKILEFLDNHNIKATIFTVGSLAEKDPNIVQKIHAMGHEIAHHSYDHITLNKQSPDEFREDTYRAKQILEDITGTTVHGYRAPVFSLTRQTIWAIDILKDLGFTYSSSILAANNPLHGMPGVPSSPFLWQNGLLEIPVPLTKIGPIPMPYLGGFYFRYLPLWFIHQNFQKTQQNAALWSYFHPYDFDNTETNWRIKNASVPVSLLLWLNRKNTFKKLERFAQNIKFNAPFKDQDFSSSALPTINLSSKQ